MTFEFLNKDDVVNFYNKKSRNDCIDDIKMSDLVLVRTMDNFPFDKFIKSRMKANVLESIDSFNNPFSYLLDDNNMDEVIPSPLIESSRNTIHFCINGVVSNHMLGNFGGRSFIVFDPIIYHINNKSEELLSLRGEDTYFRGNICLSDYSFILLSKEQLLKLNNIEKDNLTKFKKVFIYDNFDLNNLVLCNDFGEEYNNYLIEDSMVGVVLERMGYPSFRIGQHGFQEYNDNNVKTVLDLIENLKKIYSIGCELHFYSVYRKDEEDLRFVRTEAVVKDYFKFIVSKLNIPEKLKKELLLESESICLHPNYNKELLREILKYVSVDDIICLTKKYNEMIVLNKNSKKKRM